MCLILQVSEKFNAGFELPFVACCGYGDIGYYNYSIKALTLIVEEQEMSIALML